ncbi:DnaJ-domain-containing protein [Basidiobolus meristosporus CBS 931.73]|uniref:DnaJ-domain-containing protein n=1 Tax=Basidiobolus meristosporus CBS 931.73 TaxID=1314790 RepID=A0A1Y1YWN7_9FUNG|nr:DnaJ-domain-containing protein [Basidiobolus meristosporus CBS 931.73]|eukprot:ORY02431.1 DnaJ-domain-containing protein [Basidiobolus meristosporus CBS 931.73]
MDPYLPSEEAQLAFEEEPEEVDLNELEQSLQVPKEDFYGVLNVTRRATEEEIKDSYRKLCRTFHPDKHTDPELQQIAQSRFQIIQKAYEVLTDPTKRASYDNYGEEGLRYTFEPGTNFNDRKEMEEEQEKLKRKKREEEIESLIKVKSEISVQANATPLFAFQPSPFNDPSLLSRFKQCGVSQLYMKHTLQTNIFEQTQAGVTATMLSRNSFGGGNLTGTLRHTFSGACWGEISTTVLNPRVLQGRLFYNLSPDSFIDIHTVAQTTKIPPSFSFTAGQRVGATSTGYVAFKSGQYSLGPWGRQIDQMMRREYSSFAIGLANRAEKSEYNTELQMGLSDSHLTFDYTYTLNPSSKLNAALVLSTGGLNVVVGGDSEVHPQHKVGFSVESGIPSGVTLKLRYTRPNQQIFVPIMMTPVLNLRVALLSIMVPLSAGYAIDKLYLQAKRKKEVEEKIKNLREYHGAYLSARKRDALRVVSLLQKAAAEKTQEEEAKNGLVIVKALYGIFDKEHPEYVADVTVPLQALVHESQLIIAGGHSKSNISGFYDPCFGSRKQLKILYKFNRRMHSVVVADTSPLACPLRAHLIHDA